MRHKNIKEQKISAKQMNNTNSSYRFKTIEDVWKITKYVNPSLCQHPIWESALVLLWLCTHAQNMVRLIDTATHLGQTIFDILHLQYLNILLSDAGLLVRHDYVSKIVTKNEGQWCIVLLHYTKITLMLI